MSATAVKTTSPADFHPQGFCRLPFGTTYVSGNDYALFVRKLLPGLRLEICFVLNKLRIFDGNKVKVETIIVELADFFARHPMKVYA